MQDVSRVAEPVRRPQGGDLGASLARAEAALQQWQRAEHAVVQSALELHECDSGTGMLKARRNEYLAWRSYSKVSLQSKQALGWSRRAHCAAHAHIECIDSCIWINTVQHASCAVHMTLCPHPVHCECGPSRLQPAPVAGDPRRPTVCPISCQYRLLIFATPHPSFVADPGPSWLLSPAQALDELKVLEYRLNNQGNSFRGSFQLNEFGYDYGRSVPDMSEREREAAVNKRRHLKQKTATLKVGPG